MPPDDECLWTNWQGVVIDALTITVRSDNEINVTVPVAATLLTYDWTYESLPWHTGPDTDFNVCLLLRALAKEVYERCLQRLPEEEAKQLELLVGKHKKPATKPGVQRVEVLQYSDSDRPAFCIFWYPDDAAPPQNDTGAPRYL